jgi:hypothetical protein
MKKLIKAFAALSGTLLSLSASAFTPHPYPTTINVNLIISDVNEVLQEEKAGTIVQTGASHQSLLALALAGLRVVEIQYQATTSEGAQGCTATLVLTNGNDISNTFVQYNLAKPSAVSSLFQTRCKDPAI